MFNQLSIIDFKSDNKAFALYYLKEKSFLLTWNKISCLCYLFVSDKHRKITNEIYIWLTIIKICVRYLRFSGIYSILSVFQQKL